WAFRYGPASVAGDKFKLGPIMDSGALLLGRGTWQLFSRLWPTRSDDFSNKMNAMRKYVVSGAGVDTQAWRNSTLLEGDLVSTVRQLKTETDLVVAGSASVAHLLMRE